MRDDSLHGEPEFLDKAKVNTYIEKYMHCIFRHLARHSLGLSRTASLAVVILVVCYFSSQVELFDDEYEANHPPYSSGPTFVSMPLSFECDKENAQEAYEPVPIILVKPLFLLPFELVPEIDPHIPFQPVHDKSPPRPLYQDNSLV